jgi:demethylmenaquinone methyltransferase/2-methoxy-6-polyprenyl-1,4-benzoquinol methylase
MTADSAYCFDTLATDTRWHEFRAAERRTVAAFVRRWRIQPGDRVLEPGCGSGRLTAVLAALTGPAGRVVAFDSSPEFMRLVVRRRLPRHVTLHTARADTLPLAPASFDHVVCFNVFPHLVPQATMVRRFAAALRPGGVFWIAHTGSRQFVNAVHRSGPPSLHDHLLPAPRLLARLLRAAGLDEVEIEDRADHFLARAINPTHLPASLHADGHA